MKSCVRPWHLHWRDESAQPLTGVFLVLRGAALAQPGAELAVESRSFLQPPEDINAKQHREQLQQTDSGTTPALFVFLFFL